MNAFRIFKITDWFSVAYCTTWFPGYQIVRTMVINPSYRLDLFIIPGRMVSIGVKR